MWKHDGNEIKWMVTSKLEMLRVEYNGDAQVRCFKWTEI